MKIMFFYIMELVPINGPNEYCGNFSEILILNRGVHEPLEEFCFQEMINSKHL